MHLVVTLNTIVCGRPICLISVLRDSDDALTVQVATVLDYAHANDIGSFLGPAVDLALALLHRDARELEDPSSYQKYPDAGHSVALADVVVSLVAFCAAPGGGLAAAAAECAVLLSEVRSRVQG
jgi:hypothetical protein